MTWLVIAIGLMVLIALCVTGLVLCACAMAADVERQEEGW